MYTTGVRKCLKKSLNAFRPSEHPPVRGGNVKRLGAIIGCKYKTCSWHLNEFPDGSNIINRSPVQYRGETQHYAVH